jgi:hypothetical protein
MSAARLHDVNAQYELHYNHKLQFGRTNPNFCLHFSLLARGDRASPDTGRFNRYV